MNRPLAEKLRPSNLEEIAGQKHILENESWIQLSITQKKPHSILLCGPPGCGKTTLGRIYAQSFRHPFIFKSAVNCPISEIKSIAENSQKNPLFSPFILFVDELHRYNKAQQDIFLPFIEDGTLVLIGATTENPSYCLNNALLSRLRVLTLKPLDFNDLEKILNRFESKNNSLELTEEGKTTLFEASCGDGRYLINMIEMLSVEKKPIPIDRLKLLLQKKPALYDQAGDNHYHLISALHKSIRGSDPDAALYWLARMIDGGEDPLYLCRRLIRLATEDIGLASPQALTVCLSAWDTYHRLGSPEAELALAQAVVYLALSPKSNSIYKAYQDALTSAKKTGHLKPPAIVNPDRKIGKDYIYDPETELGFSGQNYFPDEMQKERYYFPKEGGFEQELKKRLDHYHRLRTTLNSQSID